MASSDINFICVKKIQCCSYLRACKIIQNVDNFPPHFHEITKIVSSYSFPPPRGYFEKCEIWWLMAKNHCRMLKCSPPPKKKKKWWKKGWPFLLFDKKSVFFKLLKVQIMYDIDLITIHGQNFKSTMVLPVKACIRLNMWKFYQCFV